MQFSEKELEDMIFDDLRQNHGLTLINRGFDTPIRHLIDSGESPKTKWLRQVNLGPYGIADIIGYYRHGTTIVVQILELKVVPIKSDDFDQVLRYRRAIQDLFGYRFRIKFWISLIGPSINDGHYIHNLLNDFIVVEYKYDLNGISFEMHAGSWRRNDVYKINPIKLIRDAEKIHGY